MNSINVIKKINTILLTYLIMLVGYIFYCFFYSKDDLSIISIFYLIVLAGGGGFIPFGVYLFSYEFFYIKYFMRNSFITYWIGGIVYAIIVLILFISFDIITMGKESFFKKEVILGDYNLFIVFAPISLVIDWLTLTRSAGK
jgi:hypothetical protein